ncbi:MAG TPA: hypothetical protein VK963_04700 [Candidatus Saccharimonadales bacterium]|nr:hypothetical protein [Candidatus Saccharimonadales bacterium]
MSIYDGLRRRYQPDKIKWLLVAESPPPAAEIESSRHFYRVPAAGSDRLFVNTIKALYREGADQTEAELGADKQRWLRRFQADGCYMIEALEQSLQHQVTKPERQELIRQHLPRLIERVGELAGPDTKIILIKSNVFVAATEALKQACWKVLNHELIDYPGQFNQRRYRKKLQAVMKGRGWQLQ